mgnify:CR=1 FL=1
MRSIVLHLHNPKTAGTNFNAVLRRTFGESFLQDRLLCGAVSYQPEHVRQAALVKPQRAFASHALRASSVPTTDDQRNFNICLIPISFCRDPIEKAISGYFDLRNRVAGPQHAALHMSIAEIVAEWAKRDFDSLEFGISRSQTQWYFPQSRHAMADIERDIGEDRLLLLPSCRMDEALVCLERAYPQLLPDLSYGRRQNVSTKDHALDENDLAAITQLPWIDEDRGLLDLANQLLARKQNELFGSTTAFDEHLLDFQHRCRQRMTGQNSVARRRQFPRPLMRLYHRLVR